ncbi:MAG: hypothetical protein KDA44_19815 [Planctomycetales bacterium]|nr:hypothetical protein [Planctomycetales bacterium]
MSANEGRALGAGDRMASLFSFLLSGPTRLDKRLARWGGGRTVWVT